MRTIEQLAVEASKALAILDRAFPKEEVAVWLTRKEDQTQAELSAYVGKHDTVWNPHDTEDGAELANSLIAKTKDHKDSMTKYRIAQLEKELADLRKGEQ